MIPPLVLNALSLLVVENVRGGRKKDTQAIKLCLVSA